jgi:hypothetical protein
VKDRPFRHLHVAAAPLRLAAHVGRRVLRDLLRHRLVHLAEAGHRVRGPDVRAGGHGGDVGGDGDHEAGGGAAGARRGHEDRDGSPRTQHAVDDLPHRAVEPPGGVHADDEEGRPGCVGAVDRLHDVRGAHGMHDAVELDDRDVGTPGGRHQQRQGGRERSGPPSGHVSTLGTRAQGVNAGAVC